MKKSLFIIFILIVSSAGVFFAYDYAVNSQAPGKSQAINSPTKKHIATPIITTPTIAKTASNKKDTLTLSFAGDVLLDRSVANVIGSKGANFILSDVKPILSGADISMINLECPISTRGTKAKDKQYTFRAKPSSVDVLKSAGIDIVTLANNHVLDFGKDAMLDTFTYLDKAGIKYVGAGNNLDKASMAKYYNINGFNVAILGSSHVIPVVEWAAGKNKPGVATTYNPARLLSEINIAKKKADIVVVYLHWGTERNTKPDTYQRNLAKKYIDSGADLVIGSHPHVLQGFEYYKGKLIAYSLGNFVFTNVKNDTMILNVKFNKDKSFTASISPCSIDNYRPVVLKDKSKQTKLFDKLQQLSFSTKIDKKGVISK
ncbi:CapA family protein [Pseudobacteroides cellulosolvens]|uniref:Capsule synthesis protein, CapA n=1 Tax=Pseudobacteroides cellulosolvens ATCC 35603 = DSM 2933 TaxID=398512 RepID=A0A0L6JKD8_9FIRM|nr:CapA family protein [Pseudobacteroides cellulosolvens]KNY26210.1 Capsule synthesis protein, CapA [Pseudobacteroides cellulosolvens ATCC 35603 = DSM 2933]